MNKQSQLIRNDTDYAVRMLLYLALNNHMGPISAIALSKAQNVPLGFAYKILSKLNKAKLVRSINGRSGGFVLGKKPEQISLLAVMESVQGRIVIRKCLLNDKSCPAHSECPVSYQLQKLQIYLQKSMQDLTLAEIIKTRHSSG